MVTSVADVLDALLDCPSGIEACGTNGVEFGIAGYRGRVRNNRMVTILRRAGEAD